MHPKPLPLPRRRLPGLAVLAAIVAAWLASLVLPALDVRGAPSPSGLELLLEGWQGASRGVFAWYANPLFVAAVVLAAARRARAAGIVSGVAVVLASTSFAAEDVLRDRLGSVPDISFRAGFYLWLAALIALFIWSWAAVYSQHRNNLRAPR